MNSTLVLRSLRAELIRTGGRSRLWTVMMPAAAAVPVAITFGIAAVAESFARIPGQLSVLSVATSNAAYWVITITVVLAAVAAADGQACESRYRAGEYVRLAIGRPLPVLAGRWLFYGAVAAAVAAVTLVVVLVALPVVSPSVYGTVSVADEVGRRLLWTVPVLAFFAAGAGVGIGALIRSPLGAAGAILLWAYAFESAAGYLPSGASLQRFMPLLNAVFATGQDSVLTPPWGQDLALLYVCALFTAIFALAVAERTVRK
ncbi:ABC transporter permease [Mycolicibacterium sp. XJ1819]